MKKVRFFLLSLLLTAAAVLFSGACWADGSGSTDPQPTTKGCGGGNQPACDQTPLGESITLTFNQVIDGDLAASADIYNPGTTPDGQFTVTFPSTITITDPTTGLSTTEGLSYTCGPVLAGGYSCMQEGDTDTFIFTSPAILDDLCAYPDGFPESTPESSEETTGCQPGESVILLATAGDPSNLSGASLMASTSASVPEPASGLLLLFGLATAGGLTGFRKRLYI